jgi:transcriptional regulator with XRE-family HTH domain
MRLDLNQGELAALVGWPRNMISQYECGVAWPSVERLIRLLGLATVNEERGPILKVLEARGILALDLAPSLISPRGDVSLHDSMTPVSSDADETSIPEEPIFSHGGNA